MVRLTRASVAKAAAAAAAVTSSSSTLSARSSSASAITPTFVASSSPQKRRRIQSSSSSHPKAMGSSENDGATRGSIQRMVHSLIRETASSNEVCLQDSLETRVLGGWCLVDALMHCAEASSGALAPLIKKYGPPKCYMNHLVQINNTSGSKPIQDDEFRSFRSLCRIVSGQQLAGAAAYSIWKRLLAVVGATEDDPGALTPNNILDLVKSPEAMETEFRQPAGISRAKCNCIVAIAQSFKDGDLSDDLLMSGANNDEDVRSRLLAIKGLGPWSVDMFLLFQCHRSDVLPVGDLAVRNGTAFLWNVKGSAKGGLLCAKKDLGTIHKLHKPFAPYRSVSSHYMYRAVEEQRSNKK